MHDQGRGLHIVHRRDNGEADGVENDLSKLIALFDILRKRVKIKWEKDRGKEPVRDKKDFPWFWNGSEFTGDRVNDVYLSLAQKAKQ